VKWRVLLAGNKDRATTGARQAGGDGAGGIGTVTGITAQSEHSHIAAGGEIKGESEKRALWTGNTLPTDRVGDDATAEPAFYRREIIERAQFEGPWLNMGPYPRLFAEARSIASNSVSLKRQPSASRLVLA
jgi:hypothetical protein